MKRRLFGGGGGGRWRRARGEMATETITMEEEQPLLKGMKLEVEGGENGPNNNAEDTITPMVISMLNQQQHNGASSSHNFEANSGQQRDSQQMFPLMNIRSMAEREPRDKLFNAQLIQEVSRHPALYDFTTEEYKNIEARNRHWQEVSDHVDQPLEFVRTRWKTLRDRFKKEVRRVQTNQPGIVWQHYEAMTYLLPFVRDKLDDMVYGDAASTSAPTTMPTTSSRHQKQQQQQMMVNGGNGVGVGPMNPSTCTAAILDLAMSAVNKFSPSAGNSASPQSSEYGGNGAEELLMMNTIGGGGPSNGATALINSTGGSQIRTNNFHTATEQHQQNNKGGGCNNCDDEDEDQLFCRIVLRKLGKLEDRMKEKAKAKIMEMLVEMQFGNETTD